MTIIYRTSGPWGPGQGSDLTANQVDTNFYQIAQAVAALQAVEPGRGIDYISVSGDQMIIHLTDHSIQGPFTLPTANWVFRDAWQPLTLYNPFDVITAGGDLYLVLFEHTSAATFDPGANDGMGHQYYALLLAATSAVPAGGTTGQILAKHSDADYDIEWIDESGAAITGIPAGGATNEVLIKHSGADYDVFWGVPLALNGVPAGGTTGQLLSKTSSVDYAVGFIPAPIGLIPGGLTGDVLTKHSGTDYDISWETPSTTATHIYSALGAPTTTYNDGDIYLDANNGDLYVQTTGAWGSAIGNIRGPAGTAGTNGVNGSNGSTWYDGSGAPVTLHANGDYYLDVVTGNYYKQTSGAWGLIGTITPQGIPAGGTTGQVLTKNSGTNYDVSWATPSGGGGGGAKWPRRNGSITAPAVASSWTTLGTGTLADFSAGSDNGVRLTAAGNGSNHLFGMYKSQSFASNFTLSVGIRLHTPIVDSVGFGVLLWNTSNSKGYFMGVGAATTYGRWKYDGSATSFDGTNDYGSNGFGGYGSKTFLPEFFIRVALVGSNLNWYWSYDGNYWMLLKTLTTTEYNASGFNSIGLGLNRNLNTGNFNFELAMDCADFNVV